MKSIDMQMYREHFPVWAKEIQDEVKSVLILSPNSEQMELLREIFPKASVEGWDYKNWDLNMDGPQDFDLIMAGNVFMCSRDPELWFRVVLARCRFFWMQDQIRARRNPPDECATFDGDHMRYCWPPDHTAVIPNAFDLRQLGEKICQFVPYHSPGQIDGKSFLLYLRGDLWYNGRNGTQTDSHISRSSPSQADQGVEVGDGERTDRSAQHRPVESHEGPVPGSGLDRKRRGPRSKPDRA